MDATQKQKLLRIALVAFGAVFILVYPISLVWPAGWSWGQGYSHFWPMIVGLYVVWGVFLLLAARNPAEHRSLIAFTAWASLVHGLVMAVQAYQDGMERGHLIGDVPALILVFIVLMLLAPKKAGA
jgi:hypothetical protein